jgi:ATP-dependent DNA ligase
MVRDGRVRLYTIHGADWSKRYPLVTEAVSRIDGSAILDAEVVWIGSDGAANFDALHSRVNDQSAVALAFDLMSLDGEDFRQKPFSKRKAVLRKVLGGPVAAFSTWSTPKATEATCSRLSASLAWRISSQRDSMPPIAWSVEDLDQSQKSKGTGSHAVAGAGS